MYNDEADVRNVYKEFAAARDRYYATGWDDPDKEAVKAELDEAEANYKAASDAFHAKCYGYTEDIPKDDPSYRRWRSTRKVKDGEYEWMKDYFQYKTIDESLARLDKDLNREVELKYDDLINRANKVVGQITDASNLSVGPKGELDGIIEGTKGKARIETIGAGGYNIQIFHYRVLIHPIK